MRVSTFSRSCPNSAATTRDQARQTAPSTTCTATPGPNATGPRRPVSAAAMTVAAPIRITVFAIVRCTPTPSPICVGCWPRKESARRRSGGVGRVRVGRSRRGSELRDDVFGRAVAARGLDQGRQAPHRKSPGTLPGIDPREMHPEGLGTFQRPAQFSHDCVNGTHAGQRMRLALTRARPRRSFFGNSCEAGRSLWLSL
jgi:hypothetical protein